MDRTQDRGRRQPRGRPPFGPVGLVLLALVGAGTAAPVAALQEGSPRLDSVPPDTWGSPEVRALLGSARELRTDGMEGIRSYEGVLHERIHVGLSALRFRRARTVLEQERAARIRWSREGERVVRWEGARLSVPIVTGMAQVGEEGEAATALQEAMREDLSREFEVPALAFDPWDDRLVFGPSREMLHPLADSAALHYRYRAGDTLRIQLPSVSRTVVLAEVRVEPRRASPDLVAGSLWFDVATGALVRATYRLARPWDLELDAPEDAGDVPGFLKPVTGEIDYVTMEYGLQELRWWLPRRFALEGGISLGSFARVPLTLEWTVGDYVVNQAPSPAVRAGGRLPPGWIRSQDRLEGEGGGSRWVTVITPPLDSLRASTLVSTGLEGADPTAFAPAEIDEIRDELDRLVPSTPAALRPRVIWGLRDGLVRYNRVEGLSVGVRLESPVAAGWSATATVRLGTADLEPRGEVAAFRGRRDEGFGAAAYRRLAWAGDEGPGLDDAASLGNLLFGSDRVQYFQATGVEVHLRGGGYPWRWTLRGFGERQEPVRVETDFFLLEPVMDRDPDPLIRFGSGAVAGGALRLERQWGQDPSHVVVTSAVSLEAAGGDFGYWRGDASLGAVHPVPLGLSGAWEVAAGVAALGAPVQQNFFLGGRRTVRGLDWGARQGTAYWRGRLEVGGRLAAVRPTVFGDVAWAGPREEFGSRDWVAGVGAGLSFLDGIVRADVARAVRGDDSWKGYLYVGALF